MNQFIKKNLILIFFVGLVVYDFAKPIDSTDVSRFNRSGLRLITDNFTKCQYLSSPHGFFGKEVLVPRVDKNGKHICE